MGFPMNATSYCRLLAGLALVAAQLGGLACNAQPATPMQMVAMSDSVRLATDVY